MQSTAKNAKGIESLARQFRAAGDPTRLRILRALSGSRRVCVSEVAAKLGLSVAIVSHHMRTLARGGLVSPERHGKRVCYRPAASSDIVKLIKSNK